VALRLDKQKAKFASSTAITGLIVRSFVALASHCLAQRREFVDYAN
jgi:hypothetical protein